eukprot:COSAG01_NODE_782_length_13631_cov_73.763450_5_plen_92_part_00
MMMMIANHTQGGRAHVLPALRHAAAAAAAAQVAVLERELADLLRGPEMDCHHHGDYHTDISPPAFPRTYISGGEAGAPSHQLLAAHRPPRR